MTSGEELAQVFGSYLSPEKDAEWDRAEAALPPGTFVTGTVVLRYIFGIFVDIGVGFPALLPVTHFNPPAKRRPVVVEDYPGVGTIIRCRVVSFQKSSRQIGLTQLSPHPTLDAERGDFVAPVVPGTS